MTVPPQAPDVTVDWVLITPEIATTWLANNPRNRNLRPRAPRPPHHRLERPPCPAAPHPRRASPDRPQLHELPGAPMTATILGET